MRGRRYVCAQFTSLMTLFFHLQVEFGLEDWYRSENAPLIPRCEAYMRTTPVGAILVSMLEVDFF